ncbi:MAG: hypothetical protein ACRC8W_04810 [Plesiomonas shigelloides]
MRESGWYRVKHKNSKVTEVALCYNGFWSFVGTQRQPEEGEIYVYEMIMTLSGEMVYHNAEHNPVYNTKQEG